MSLYISSLNSGSNGNAYYVGNHKEAILVDAGLSCREMERRMTRLGLQMKNVKAIFISHEHSDHIRGVEVTARKHKMPVYITGTTLRDSRLAIEPAQVKNFRAYEPVQVGDLKVLAFPKSHDACEPHSFVIEGGGVKVGVFTDIGENCEHVIKNFRECNAAFLEANYDEKMLQEGAYPYHLKKRISSAKGHLSNLQALHLFTKHKPAGMSHLLLAHLSKDNNDPALVQALFSKHAGGTFVTVASRYHESEVYQITGAAGTQVANINAVPQTTVVQMSLF